MKIYALKVVAVGWLLTGGTASESAAQQEPEKKELAKLEGTWSYVGGQVAGKKVPDELLGTMRITIKGNTYTGSAFGMVVDEGTITVDPTKKPRTWQRVSRKLKGFKMAAIYELDGDTLKYCEKAGGDKLPTKFESAAGSLDGLYLLKRQKGK